MKSLSTFLSILLLLFVIGITGCSDDDRQEMEQDANEAASDAGEAMEDAADDAGDAADDAMQEMGDEAVEKLVEAKLVTEDGFGGVTVESKPDGVIILTGTVATEDMKMKAQTITENVDGVESVENELVVSK